MWSPPHCKRHREGEIWTRNLPHFTAHEWSIEATQILLDDGANVDPVKTHGNSPFGERCFVSRYGLIP